MMNSTSAHTVARQSHSAHSKLIEVGKDLRIYQIVNSYRGSKIDEAPAGCIIK